MEFPKKLPLDLTDFIHLAHPSKLVPPDVVRLSKTKLPVIN